MSFDPPNYSIIEGTEAAYRGFWPRPDFGMTPPGAIDIMVTVDEGVKIGCRLYPRGPEAPTILYFHGNGEIVGDYNDMSSAYTQIGINLFVADYRGYGFSTGTPSFPTMMSDAHLLLKALRDFMSSNGYNGPLYVMGRSMGGNPAVDLAAHYPQILKGLIMESASASANRIVEHLNSVGKGAEAEELERRHRGKIRSISMPVLSLHGEWDTMISLDRAIEFFNTLTVENKRMEIIPGAGHNDIMWVGLVQYMTAIKEFVFGGRA